MKKLLLLLMFVPLMTIGQVKKMDSKAEEVGVAKNFGVEIAKLSKVAGEPDYYFFTYNNLKYDIITDVDSFGFKDIDGAFDYLYNGIVDVYKNKSKAVEFELADGMLSVQHQMGAVRFYFINKAGVDSWTGYMTKKQMATLFGKKYNKADFKK
ncbi:hypothetical protein OAV08_00995 [Flavobacteriaceae bacterium]|nr:hypothetical protein [Flavobacteriaceae bacterium]